MVCHERSSRIYRSAEVLKLFLCSIKAMLPQRNADILEYLPEKPLSLRASISITVVKTADDDLRSCSHLVSGDPVRGGDHTTSLRRQCFFKEPF